MAQQNSSSGIQYALTFMFHDPQWQRKLLIGFGLMFAGMIVPVIPLLFTTGYVYRIMERILRGDGEPVLPEWSDWSKLFLDGLRFLGALLLYWLPAILLFILGYGLMIVLPLIGAVITSVNDQAWIFILLQIGGMLFGFGVFALGTLLALAISLFSPLALSNLVAKDRFIAAFRPREWWQVLRANPSGYFLAWLITFGLSFVTGIAYQVIYMTIVLCCLLPFFVAAASIYLSCVTSALFASAYRQGLAGIENPTQAMDQAAENKDFNAETT